MQKINFEYNEPRFGVIEVEGPDLGEEDILKLIEQEYPEAIDVEIIGREEING